jgi:RecA-family ATPase
MKLDLQQMMFTPPEPLDFIFPGFLTNSVACLVGRGGVGKSIWSMQFAMCVASKAANHMFRFLDDTITQHGKVVLFNAEDNQQILHHRIFQISSTLSPEAREEVSANLCIESVIGEQALFQKNIKTYIESSMGARLVIFDTLNRFHRENENDNSEMSKVIHLFEQISRETNAAVLIVHHTGKPKSRPSSDEAYFELGRGASAISDNVRFVMSLSRRANMLTLSVQKQNYENLKTTHQYKQEKNGLLRRIDDAEASTTNKKSPTSKLGKIKP